LTDFVLHNLTTLEVATALVEEVVCAAALVPVDLAILSSLVVATIVQEPSRGGVCLVFGTCVVADVDACNLSLEGGYAVLVELTK